MIEISHLGHSLRLKEHRTILAYQMGFLVVCYLCPKTPILANGWWNATLLLLLLLQLPEHEAASERIFLLFFRFSQECQQSTLMMFFPFRKKKQIYMVAWQEGRRGRGGARWLKRSQKKRCLACAPLGLSHRYRECVRERHGHSSPSSPSSVALFQGPSSNSHFIHVDLISPTDTFLFPPLLWTWWPLGTVLVRGRLGVAPLRLRTNSPPKQSVNPKNNFVLNTSLQPQNNIPHALLRWQKEKQKKSEQPH